MKPPTESHTDYIQPPEVRPLVILFYFFIA